MPKKLYNEDTASTFLQDYLETFEEGTPQHIKDAVAQMATLISDALVIARKNNFNLGMFFDPKFEGTGMIASVVANRRTNDGTDNVPNSIPLLLRELFETPNRQDLTVYLLFKHVEAMNDPTLIKEFFNNIAEADQDKDLCDCPACAAEREFEHKTNGEIH